jgi:hypothetical protein
VKSLACGVVLCALVAGCAAFQRAMPFLPTPYDLACVADQVEKGVRNPITIVEACPHLADVAAADIEALVVNLLAAKRAERASAMRAGASYCSDAGTDAK